MLSSLRTSSLDHLAPRPRVRWVYPAVLAATIVLASGHGQVAVPAVVHIDKGVHFLVFGLMATLVVRAPGVGRGWVAVAGVSLFGVLDELRQGFTPGRSMELADWLADTAGAGLAVLLYNGWPWYRGLLESSPAEWRARWSGGAVRSPAAVLAPPSSAAGSDRPDPPACGRSGEVNASDSLPAA
jgi:hypothetical protein